MSNPWAKSFEDLRAPYLAEKKAKKDYDGDGKIESGTDEYMGSKDKAIKKAMAEKGKKKVAEHHQKDAAGNTIPHEEEGDGTPSSVEEMKKFGPGGDPIKKPGFIDKALDKLKKNTPVKKVDKAHYEPEGEVIDELNLDSQGRMKLTSADVKLNSGAYQKSLKDKGNKVYSPIITKAHYEPEGEVIEAKIDKIDPKNKRNRRNVAKFGKQTKPYDPPTKEMKTSMGKFMQKTRQDMHNNKRGVKKEEVVIESDKKGSGSGTKDACYKKVKASASVWPSAYASGRLVQCRKKGAANYGNSKKEEFDFRIKSFDELVGECWKTHKKQGMKMKGGKMVPNCVPKNEEFVGEEGINKDPAFDIMRPGGANSPFNADGTPKKPSLNKVRGTAFKKEDVFIEALKGKKLEVQETGVKNKIEINPEIKTEAAKAPVKK